MNNLNWVYISCLIPNLFFLGCENICGRNYLLVCASNGEKYHNVCIYKIAQCKDPFLKKVPCKKRKGKYVFYSNELYNFPF